MPVTNAVLLPVAVTVATEILLLVHTPPPIVELKVAVPSVQILGVDAIMSGVSSMLTDVVAMQEPIAYVIRAMPGAIPVITPLLETLATVASEEVHTPPFIVLLKGAVFPVQICPFPVMGEGAGAIVIVAVVMHPPESVYEIIAVPIETVESAPSPIPEETTVAIKVLELVHVPPVSALLNMTVVPRQAALGPIIGPGDGLTVMDAVLRQPAPVV